VREFISTYGGSSASVQPDDDNMCSNFDAAKVRPQASAPRKPAGGTALSPLLSLCAWLNIAAFAGAGGLAGVGQGAQCRYCCSAAMLLDRARLRHTLANASILARVKPSLCIHATGCRAQNDITAVGALLCKHRHVIAAINITGGEKYVYATFLLFTLLRQCGLLFFYYDINCRYSTYWTRWLPVLALANPAVYQVVRAAAANLQFPLPPFHKFAHRCGRLGLALLSVCTLPRLVSVRAAHFAAHQHLGYHNLAITQPWPLPCTTRSPKCQWEFNPLYKKGAGRGNGEPAEILWSKCSSVGHTTQV
jgi:hypothetical protein